MQQQADHQLQVVLDKETYNETDLITIKVPLNLPYITGSKEFERIDGEVNVNGTVYKYVKRKIDHGELVLLCLPDDKRTKLETAKDDFLRLSSDLQQNNANKKSGNTDLSPLKNLLTNYDMPTEAWLPGVLVKEIACTYKPYLFSECRPVITSPKQPPKFVKA